MDKWSKYVNTRQFIYRNKIICFYKYVLHYMQGRAEADETGLAGRLEFLGRAGKERPFYIFKIIIKEGMKENLKVRNLLVCKARLSTDQ